MTAQELITSIKKNIHDPAMFDYAVEQLDILETMVKDLECSLECEKGWVAKYRQYFLNNVSQKDFL